MGGLGTDVEAFAESSRDDRPKIKRGKIEFMSIYEMSEGELESLERGSKSSTYLTFSISLLSIAASFFTTLVTIDFTGKVFLFTIFLTVTIVTTILGLLLLFLWRRTKNETDEILEKIRARIESQDISLK